MRLLYGTSFGIFAGNAYMKRMDGWRQIGSWAEQNGSGVWHYPVRETDLPSIIALPQPEAGVAIGLRFVLDAAPTDDSAGLQLLNNSGDPIATFCFQSNGSVSVKDGGIAGAEVGVSESSRVMPGDNYLEIAVSVGTDDAIELAWLGLPVLSLRGDILASADPVAAFSLFNSGSGAAVDYYSLQAFAPDEAVPIGYRSVIETPARDYVPTPEKYDAITDLRFSRLPGSASYVEAMEYAGLAQLERLTEPEIRIGARLPTGEETVASSVLSWQNRFHAVKADTRPGSLTPWVPGVASLAFMRMDRTGI